MAGRCIALALVGVAIAACGRDASKTPAASTAADDLRILDGARRRLADERHWNRNDNRECPAGAQVWSLYCALHDASIEVLGVYDHRRLALEEVRAAIEAVTDEDFQHRLMDFNNRPSTTLADVHRVIEMARERIASK
jgi:hypothetical protein